MSLAAKMTRNSFFLLDIVPIDLPVKEFFKKSNPGQRYGLKRAKKLTYDAKRVNDFTKTTLAHSWVHQSSSLKFVVTPNIIQHIWGQNTKS